MTLQKVRQEMEAEYQKKPRKPLHLREKSGGDQKYNTGISVIDEGFKGFVSGGVYVVAGKEKSGKSSFILNVVANLLRQKVRVGYLNTELSDDDFKRYLTSIWLGIDKNSLTKGLVEGVLGETVGILDYAGVDDITTNLSVTFDALISQAEEMANLGSKVLVFDNLTTAMVQSEEGWKSLQDNVAKIINLSKAKNIVSLIVIHTKQLAINDAPKSVKEYIKDNQPEKIFQETLTYNRRPTSEDFYGGKATWSQIYGSVIIWRPYQDFQEIEYSGLAMVIFEGLRHQGALDFLLRFDGKTSRFLNPNKDAFVETVKTALF